MSSDLDDVTVRPEQALRMDVASSQLVREPPEPIASSTRTFTDGLRTAWELLSSSALHTAAWFGLGVLLMLPAGHTAMVTVAALSSTANRFEPLLGITLLGFIYASIGGAILVTLDAQRHGTLERGRRLDASDAGVLLVSCVVALGSLVLVTAVGAALGLVFLIVRAFLFLVVFTLAGLVVSIFLNVLMPSVGRPSLAFFTFLSYVLYRLSSAVWDWLDDLTWTPPRRPIVRGASSHYTSHGRPKIPYATEASALDAAHDYFADRGERMNAYRCELGSHWHIGHAR